jgi:hypothetical protein
VQRPGDVTKAVPFGEQGADGYVPLPGADRDAILPVLRCPGASEHRLNNGQGHLGGRIRGGGVQVTKVMAVLGDGPFDGLAEVVPQVPAVGDLDRLGCAADGAGGIGSGPVAADDLDAGVGSQPGGQGVGGRSGSTSTGLPVLMSIRIEP